jgi:uncharacterized protein (TIGR00251 family)
VSDAVVVAVRVTPRASRDAVEGADDAGVIRVRVTAPPADGAANKATLKLLAKSLGVPRSRLTIVSGTASRHKRVQVKGVTKAILVERWPGASVEGR